MITIKDIDRQAYSLRNRNWAKRYYNDGKGVVDFGIHEENGRLIFMADVKDNWGNTVSCNLTFSQGMLLNSNCDCLYHDPNNVCGHVILAGYYYVDYLQGKENMLEMTHLDVLKEIETKELRARYLDEIKNNQEFVKNHLIHEQDIFEILLQKNKYRIEFVLEPYYHQYYRHYAYGFNHNPTPSYHLSGRIGDERMYVIKNFLTLFEQLKNKEKVTYGKYLTLVHDISIFDEPTRMILNDLEKLVKIDEKTARDIEVNAYSIDAMYKMLEKLPEHYHNIDLLERPFVAEVDVEMFEDDAYILRIVEKDKYMHQNGDFYQIEMHEKRGKLTRFTIEHPLVSKTIQKLYTRAYMPVDTQTLITLMHAFEETPEIKLLGTPKLELETVEALKLYLDVDNDALQIKFDVETKEGHILNGLDESEHLRLPDIVSKIYARLCVLDHFIIDDLMTVSLLESKTFQFLEHGLEVLGEDVEVYASESLKRIDRPSSLKIQVGISVNHGLLEVDVSSLQVSQKDLSEILRMYKRKKKYHRLDNGLILNLESEDLKELDEITKTLSLDELHFETKSKVPLFRAFQVEGSKDTFKTLDFDLHESLNVFTDKFKDMSIDDIEIVPRFKDILKPYQIHGVRWLMMLSQANLSGILADDMGLGKTLQVIAYLEGQKREKPSIVVCPASLMYNWEQEFKKFESPLKTLCINGTQDKRRALISKIQDYDVIITTYDYMRSDVALYDEMQFESMILDEAQYIKNANTKSARAVKQIDSKHRIALSGTPIENRLSELWSIFDFLMPGYLYTYHYFRNHFERPISLDQDEVAITRLRSLVEPFILRRTKKEVLDDLPEKSEKILGFDFNPQEEELYLAKLAQGSSAVGEILGMENPDKLQILKILGELRQICCDPRLLYEDFKEPSTKMKGAMEVIESVIEREEKVLVFSSFTSTLDLLEEMLNHHNIKYYKLTGQTSKEERRRLVDAFQNDKTGVFLMSLKAAGVGLNLTAAQNVIHFDPWWNVSAENQATDRTHRIGQTKDVNVFKLIMKNSIEEKILKMQEAKKELSDMFIEGSTGSFSSMSKDEIMDLFK